MAIFKGRDELIKNFQDARRSQDKKGLEAEIEVGDLLSNYLPENTYIIAQPEIGELHPDFLVISPEYGFRLIEVKNMSIRYIDEVFSNGVLKTIYGKRNPLGQVKSHADALKNYLVSNYPSSGFGDPYKDIGYCVIHKGFSKREFEYKFANNLGNWSPREKNDYYKYHLCFEEINSSANQLLAKATKFQNREFYLHSQQINQIMENVKVSLAKKDDDGYFERFDEQEEKIALVNAEMKQIKESIQTYQQSNANDLNTNNKSKKHKVNLFVYPSIVVLLIVIVFMFINSSNIGIGDAEDRMDNSSDVIKNYANLDIYMGDFIRIKAIVNRFYYDDKSDTKFLTLSDGEQNIDAIIFKGTKVPFIEEGNSYIFEGYIQTSRDDRGIELKITGVD